MEDMLHRNKNVKIELLLEVNLISHQEFRHRNCTLKASANGECEESKCC